MDDRQSRATRAAAADGDPYTEFPLLCRTAGMARVDALLVAATAGRPASLMVAGEAGVGRSAFLRTAVARAEGAGFEVAAAQGSLAGRDVPFGIVRQLLNTILDRRKCGPPKESRALARILDGDHSVDSEPATAMAELHAFCRGLSADWPLFIAVDDVTWADRVSQRWLAELGVLGSRRVAVVVAPATAPHPAGHELPPGLVALPRVDLGGLDAVAVQELASRLSGRRPETDIAQACVEATGGVPFLVRELLRAVSSEPTIEEIRAAAPRPIADELSRRLSVVEPSAFELARAVAIVGERTPLPTIARLAKLELEVALDAADMLAEAGVLANAQPLRFVHPVVENAVRENLPVGSRISGHLLAANLLRDAGYGAERISPHLVAAGPLDLDWAADTLRSAAQGALARGAPDVAVGYLRQALREELPPDLRPIVLRELGRAELLIAPARALKHLCAAAHLLEDPVNRADVALLMVDALGQLGRDVEAAKVIMMARDELGDRDEELGWRLDVANTEIALREMPDPDSDRHWLLEKSDRSATCSPDWAGLRAVHWSYRGVNREEVVRLARWTVESAELRPPRTTFWYALLALTHADELDTVEAHCVRGLEAAKRIGWRRHIAAALRCHGLVEARRGDLVKATELLEESVGVLCECGAEGNHETGVGLAHLIEVQVRRGRADVAAELVRDHGLEGDLPSTWVTGHLLHARGRLRCTLGDAAAGRDDLLRGGRILRGFRMTNPAAAGWRTAAVSALLHCGDAERAAGLAEENLAAARRWGTPRAIGVATHAAALAAPGAPDGGLLREAARILAEAPAPVELAMVLNDLGRWSLRNDDLGAGQRILAQSAELARGCGAVTQAQVPGLTTLPAAQPGLPEALTSQELKVATLARRGRTNREIAEELHLSRRTVEFHLSAVYRKLGITSREQLGVALGADSISGSVS